MTEKRGLRTFSMAPDGIELPLSKEFVRDVGCVTFGVVDPRSGQEYTDRELGTRQPGKRD